MITNRWSCDCGNEWEITTTDREGPETCSRCNEPVDPTHDTGEDKKSGKDFPPFILESRLAQLVNRLNSRYQGGAMTEAEYKAELREINAWGDAHRAKQTREAR